MSEELGRGLRERLQRKLVEQLRSLKEKVDTGQAASTADETNEIQSTISELGNLGISSEEIQRLRDLAGSAKPDDQIISCPSCGRAKIKGALCGCGRRD